LGAPEKCGINMALLKSKTDQKANDVREAHRVFPVTAKLTREERKAVTDFAEAQGLARGQWIRDVILAELRSARPNDAALAEILGVRLLLVNVLRPLAAGQKLTPEAFDKLLDEISTAKHELAGKLVSEKRR
jgi:hypothetical protein